MRNQKTPETCRDNCPASAEALGVSVVVLAGGAPSDLPKTLEALMQQDYDPWRYEIIVLDDLCVALNLESPDFPLRRIRCFGSDQAEQISLGVRTAKFGLVGFLDPGQAPRHDWLSKTVRHFHSCRVHGVRGHFVTRQDEPAARVIQLAYDDRCRQSSKDEVLNRLDRFPGVYRRERLLEAMNQGGMDSPNWDVKVQETIRDAEGQIVFDDLAVVLTDGARTWRNLWHQRYRPETWKSLIAHCLLESGESDVIRQAVSVLTPLSATVLFTLLGFMNHLFLLGAVLSLLWLFGAVWEMARYLSERSFLRPWEIALPLFIGEVAEGLGILSAMAQLCWRMGLAWIQPLWNARRISITTDSNGRDR